MKQYKNLHEITYYMCYKKDLVLDENEFQEVYESIQDINETMEDKINDLENDIENLEYFLMEELDYGIDNLNDIKKGIAVTAINSFAEKLIKKIEELDPKFNREIDLTNGYLN